MGNRLPLVKWWELLESRARLATSAMGSETWNQSQLAAIGAGRLNRKIGYRAVAGVWEIINDGK
jgi:hypothetical protein